MATRLLSGLGICLLHLALWAGLTFLTISVYVAWAESIEEPASRRAAIEAAFYVAAISPVVLATVAVWLAGRRVAAEPVAVGSIALSLCVIGVLFVVVLLPFFSFMNDCVTDMQFPLEVSGCD
jgi:hypothetical protein